MNFDIENIHLGNLIKLRVNELEIPIKQICKFINTDENKIEEMYKEQFLDSDLLLLWSKLLSYDFFRIYSEHLVLYSPPSFSHAKNKITIPIFRKSIYTREMIDFILDILEKGKKSKQQIINEYRIPRSTLSKWIIKYKI
ncbi:transposase [Chryseobacterium polytrichastri]|uniref:Uncharacterized protein n=1 Tax=Chryseobacterium polytrichastri TaxID=1302687 RepID=A0A1M7L4I3_9FLAO|nr:transposase [Chryseobacterium polytrichastri]SHM72203.1 hypothetical protein SAMN05444267_10814 [Chryseobacterium polytrichastri]